MKAQDLRYNPLLRIKLDEARKLRPLMGWRERTSRVLRSLNQGRYNVVQAKTLAKWAELSGREMLSFVDDEWYWKTCGYPEHIAKVFAYKMRFTCHRGYDFVRRVRRFFLTMTRDYGVDMQKFCASLAGTLPDPSEQMKRDARALLEAMFAVWGPELVREMLLKVEKAGPEVVLDETQTAC